jgi:PAS domain S-box-containing protein
MLSELTDAIVLFDLQGSCLFANPAFDTLLGQRGLGSSGPVLSAPLWIDPSEREKWELLFELHRSGRAQILGLLTISVVLVRRSGVRIPVSVTSDRILGDDAEPIAVLCTFRRRVNNPRDPSVADDTIEELWAVVDHLTTRVTKRRHVRTGSIARTKAFRGWEPPQHSQFAPTDESAETLPRESIASLNATLEPTESLTEREQEILEEVLRGLRVATIASKLYLSEHTVRNHVKSLHRKLGMSSTAEIREALLPKFSEDDSV